jgi:N-acetylneuraminate synthase
MKPIKIGDRLIGNDEPNLIVAEIGINHNGKIDIALALIDVAVQAGCDAVKFQKRDVNVVYTPEELARPRKNPFGPTNGDLKRGLEFGEEQYVVIDRHCRDNGILWFASCWDEASVEFIERFSPPCYKIASASLTDITLLRHTRSKGRPIMLSTGMSTLEQIHRAVEVLGQENLALMHCVATYPAQDEELQLNVIRTLQREFPEVPVGYSGHDYGTTMSVCARALGACITERHITLDRSMWGSDQAASLEPAGVKLLTANIRRLEKALGNGVKGVLDAERSAMHKLRRRSDF